MEKCTINLQDMYGTLMDKAENEGYDKIKLVHKGDGIIVYGSLYPGFKDVSGLGLAVRAGMLTHPSPPKREEELADHTEMWKDRMKRLEAHGEEFQLAPLYNINALGMFISTSWEADHDPTNAAKAYGELLNKVEDYARRRKLDSSAKDKIQQGGYPMDVGAVGG